MREDWIEIVSGEILDIRDGTHDTPKYISEQTYPLVTSKNLKNGVIDFSNIKYISEQDFSEINKRSKVDIGDVLFAMIGTIGNPVLVKIEPHYSIKNIGLFKNPLKIIKSELLKYYLDSLNFYSQLEERQFLKGTTQKFIPLGHLRNIYIPLAPLPIQRAIVSKIEALFSDLDNGIANFKKAQEQLKIYRQAVLKKAFEGKFTNENVIDGELPLGWEWKKISEISNVVRGGSPRPAGDPKYYDGNIPFLKVRDITKDNGKYLNTFEFTIKEAGLHKTRQIKPNTLLLSNSGATLGVPKICMIDATMNDGIAAFLNLDERSNLYLYYFWESKTKELRNINMGAAQPNLNTDIIKNYLIPYCSFEEQNQLVQEIEFRLSVCDKVEQSLKESIEKAEALRQSILKKAFEGRLLSKAEIEQCKQAADYEPASELLKKIKVETHGRASQTKKKSKE
jgi:type I restriction enzyme, S subunit